jgi:molybdopterin/thiamine biosynthesis adenylyltransferase
MLANPIAPNADVQALIDDGYSVVIIDDRYLIVENVPYCPAAGQIEYGDIISPFSVVNGASQLNNDHTVWFTGTVPHTAQGTSLQNALVADTTEALIANRKVRCRLSNKPEQPDDLVHLLQSFHVKMLHYVNKLSRHARDIDESARADYRGRLQINAQPSVFYFPNAAIARSGLDAYEDKLRQRKVAIVGVGGTGSYILDALAKMPIGEIYIYDGDKIEPHNAYRMPGALKPGEVFGGIAKTEHLAKHYGHMRSGIIGRPVRVDEQNIEELSDCNFVFIAVDHGPSRGLIANYLVARGIPFIDVGIGVDKVQDKVQLHARARVTLVTPQTADLVAKLPTADDTEEGVYNNIQLVELNALNAVLAVVRYKQFLGFYTDEAEAETIKYKASWCQLLANKRDPA